MAFLEDYTLLDELGQGGYATVYKVRHNKLKYIRAIRVLNATIARGESDSTYQKFLEECRLLLRLGNGNHPNIVHIYQPLLKAQKAIVEMDYVDGKDLIHYIEEKHSFVETNEVIKLLTDIGSALAYCHEDIYKFCMDKDEDDLQDDPNDGSKVLLDDSTIQRLISKYRVIHNDIHSGNIIRRENGSYVLLDFGLAIDGDSVIRSSRRKNGAPEFKAPEKWDNDSILSTQSDIYSFGVVLYEFLTGRVPFLFDKTNSNIVEAEYLLGKAHKEQEPPSIYELRKMAFESTHTDELYDKDYPDWLEALIKKCLSKEIEDRFKNGRELYDFVLENNNNENTAPSNELKTELDAKSRQLAEKDKKIDSLKSQIKNLKQQIKELENASNSETPETDDTAYEISSLNDKILTLTNQLNLLEKENVSLRKKGNKHSNILWKILLICSLAFVAFMIYRNNNLQNDIDKLNDTVSGLNTNFTWSITDNPSNQSNQSKDKESNSNNVTTDYNQTIRSLNAELAQKNAKITELNNEIEKLKTEISTLKTNTTNNNDDSNSVLEEKNKTIRQLNTQINELRNQIKEKDKLIGVLNEQIGVN